MKNPPNSAARRLVETLIVNGVDHVFCVPGESYLAVLDALADVRERVTVVTCRHEASAANMAEAHAKLTGRPGVCMVTRGPGATQASVGVHTAQQDSTPLLLFVGQIARGDRGREAFQEVDYRAVFGTLAKWAVEIDQPERTAEIAGRAIATAMNGRRGPVVVALPEDMLHEDGGPAPAGPVVPARAAPDPAVMEEIAARLAAAQRPMLILGGSGWTDAATASLSEWAERHAIPVALSFRRKDLISNAHPAYAGDLGLGPNPALVERVKTADLILAVGARLGENPTQGYGLLSAADTALKLIHVHPGPEELNRVWPTLVAVNADVSLFAEGLAATDPGRTWDGATAHAAYEAFRAPIPVASRTNLSAVVAHMAEVLPEDAVITNGAGNFAAWLHRFYPHRARRTQLAPTSGAMGYGFAAAVAAKVVAPDREVVCFAGDGDFLMSGNEMATAVQYGAGFVTVVVDNGTYGTIRMHQERDYPGRVVGTDLKNPDFAAYAEAFGAAGFRAGATAEFPAAFAAARQAARTGRPALVHLIADAEDIAPGRTLTQLRGG